MSRAYQRKPVSERLVCNPSVPMTEAMLDELRRRAEHDGTTVAEIIRQCVRDYLVATLEPQKENTP